MEYSSFYLGTISEISFEVTPDFSLFPNEERERLLQQLANLSKENSGLRSQLANSEKRCSFLEKQSPRTTQPSSPRSSLTLCTISELVSELRELKSHWVK